MPQESRTKPGAVSSPHCARRSALVCRPPNEVAAKTSSEADRKRATGSALPRSNEMMPGMRRICAAATAYDEGADDVPRRSAMAKLLATETAQYVVDTAVQLHGARALCLGHLLEHLYREVRAPRIYEGASEVQRGIIAKELYKNLEAR